MSSLIDVLPLGEEVRCCTTLGILVQSDPELVGEILAKVRPIDTDRGEAISWIRPDWGKDIQKLQVTVEENISIKKEDRRLDLVFRFSLDDKPCRVLVEAKVGAAGEHGGQITDYEKQLEEWHEEGVRVIGVLLTAAPLEDFQWTTEPDGLKHFRMHLSWKDVCEAVKSRIKDRDPKDILFARLGGDLIDNLEEWIMGLKELQKRLASPASPHCYPVLIDALEMVARQACGDERLNKEPRGVEGAPWDDEKDAYWCGYWWCVQDKDWAALRLFWKYEKNRVQETNEVNWLPKGETTGYAASVRLLFGSGEDQVGKEVCRWSLDLFGQELEGLPERIRQILSQPNSK